MTDLNNKKTVFTLSEVTRSIQHTLQNRFGSAFWVKAEMNKLNYYPHSGHCYPELIEKRDGKIVAQIRATLWKEDFLWINENFLRVLQEPLKNGINILFSAKVLFDPVYGLSLRILNIDPSWSLGELEREKQETIRSLKDQGIFALNKQVALPQLPQRVAVISVETSKGYADFRKVISENSWGYSFFTMLFPALLQGDKVPESIGFQLGQIRRVQHHFDVVAIIRGGGGDAGLAGYNKLEIAMQVARFPLPVITGIGHATNETVVEMVAYKNCITPTDLANFLIQQFHNVAAPLGEARRIVDAGTRMILSDTKRNLHDTIARSVKGTGDLLALSKHRFNALTRNLSGYSGYFLRNSHEHLVRQKVMMISECGNHLGIMNQRLEQVRTQTGAHASGWLKQQGHGLEILEKQVSLLDPKNVMARGFSITLHEGKAIRGISGVQAGDHVKTITFDGTIESTVTKTQPD